MNSLPKPRPWRRMIAMVDMDALAAVVEQLDHPSLRGQPLGVVNSEKGSVIAAVSPEARALGIQAGQRWPEAQARCPALARVVARPERYAEVSAGIMAALTEVSPDLEVFAPGEAFLDLTHCQAYYRHQPARIAALIRDTVAGASGLSCRVGLAGDKTTARWAARQHSAGGILVVPPEEAEALLAPRPLAEVCGIGPGIAEFLAAYGVQVCGDMKKVPIGVPARRFGNLGRRLWLMAQGKDPAPVATRPCEPGPLSQARTLPPLALDSATLHGHFQQLAERMAQGLRRDGLQVRDFRIALRAPEGWRQDWLQAEQAGADGQAIFQLCRRFLRQHWFGEVVEQLHIQAGTPQPATRQPDFFDAPLRRGSRSGPGIARR